MRERTKLLLIVAVFAAAYLLPVESLRLQRSFLEGLFLLKDCARRHVFLSPAPSGYLMQLNQSAGFRQGLKLDGELRVRSLIAFPSFQPPAIDEAGFATRILMGEGR